jgi:hypothetical protein
LIFNQAVASSPAALPSAYPSHHRNIYKALGRHFATLAAAVIDGNGGFSPLGWRFSNHHLSNLVSWWPIFGKGRINKFAWQLISFDGTLDLISEGFP